MMKSKPEQGLDLRLVEQLPNIKTCWNTEQIVNYAHIVGSYYDQKLKIHHSPVVEYFCNENDSL